MRKLFLTISAVLLFAASWAQSVQTVINVPWNGSSTTHALLYTPPSYTGSGAKSPMYMFFHGSGEAGTDLSKIFNSTTAGGMPYLIEHGGWPADGGITNPADGQKYYPLVCSPQRNNSWSSSGDEIDYEIDYMVTHYNIDPNRIYLFGLSAGAGGITEYACHLNAAEDAPTGINNHVRHWKAAAIVPMSSATNRPASSWVVPFIADGCHAWYLGDPIHDTYGEFGEDIYDFIAATNPALVRETGNPPYTSGHGGWAQRFIFTYRENVGGVMMNIYEWSLQWTYGAASTAPTANAGSNQTITLPTSSVTLSGSGTAGTGHSISSYGWTHTAGPGGSSITSPSSASTGVTGLAQGTHTFLLTVTQNDAQTATSTVTIIVNSATPVCILGPNQTITLPTSSVSLTGAASTGTITAYSWTRISGPNTPTIVSATSAATSITGLIQGTYIFQLSLNAGASTAKDTVVVNPVPPTYAPPFIDASNTQSITVNNASVTSTYTLTGATLAGITWSKFITAGFTPGNFVILGSSYSIDYGASIPDSGAFGGTKLLGGTTSGKFYNYYHGQGLLNNLYNLGVTGTNPYQAMPTGFVPSLAIQAKLSPNDTPHIASNVTAAIALNPRAVLLIFPTNGYDVFTMAEAMLPFQTIYDTLKNRGIECFICTTAPRTDGTFADPNDRIFLKTVSDSLVNRFGSHAINIYDGLTITGTTNPLYPNSSGDSIHMSDQGMDAIFRAVQGANVFASQLSSTSAITTPTTQNTTITNLPNGVNKFQVTVKDSHGQSASDTVRIFVAVSGAPTANAGTNQTVTLPTTTATLNGTASTGTITSYSWTRTSGPNQPTFGTPTASTTIVSGLTYGTYVFQLSVNAGVSVSTVSVVVVPLPGCSHNRVTVTAFSDGSLFNDQNDPGAPYHLVPGDTAVITDAGTDHGYLTGVDFENVHGTQACPIVFMPATNLGRGVRFREGTGQFKLTNSTYIHVTGTGVPGVTYGFEHNYDTAAYRQPWNYATAGGNSHVFVITGRSANIEWDHCYTRHGGIGFEIKQDGDCADSLNKTGSPSDWAIDSILIHDNSVISPWNEGMYIGNTSPDNGPASYDIRPIVCGGVTKYPRPIRLGYVRVWNNFVDSSGRGGIQIVSGNGKAMEVDHNTVKHSGMNGDEAQGGGITTGTYAWPYIHDNVVTNTLTWGISSQGAGFTGHPMVIQNNRIDSSGYLKYYFGAATHADGADTVAEPFLFRITNNTLVYPHGIYIGTRQVDSLPALDSIRVTVRDNKIGLIKNNLGDFIQVQENGTTGYNHFQTTGNIICSNTQLDGVTPVLGIQNSDIGVTQVQYTTNCAGATAPVVNVQVTAEVIYPNSSAVLVGLATPAAGQTISTYSWTQISGPAGATFVTGSASSTSVTGLSIPTGQAQAIYVFQLQAVQNDGQIGSATIQVSVRRQKLGFNLRRHIVPKHG